MSKLHHASFRHPEARQLFGTLCTNTHRFVLLIFLLATWNLASAHCPSTDGKDTTPPEFVDPPYDQLVFCSDGVRFEEPKVVDACGNVQLTFEDEIIWSNCEGVIYNATRTWFAEDEAGNLAITAQTIFVTHDMEAPIFEKHDRRAEVACGKLDELAAPVATERCAAPSIRYEDRQIGPRQIDRTWYAVDACGNEATTTQNIVLIDHQAPSFNMLSQSLSMTKTAFDRWDFPDVEAYDECGNVTLERPTVIRAAAEEVVYQWRAIDDSGNISKLRIAVEITEPITTSVQAPNMWETSSFYLK